VSPGLSWLLGSAAMLGGVLIAAQGPIYARMSAALGGNPLFAALLAFGLATLVLGLTVLVTRASAPDVGQLARLPWWVWLGGLFGAYQVLVSMQAVPRLGVTLFLMLVILGNMLGATVFDHFGWFGLPRRPLTPGAGLGIALMLAGVFLTAGRG
tara:strand:- start:2478 stop:2939 length:462 start_codon:yes stop_codon:yes gene_type:complete